MWIIQEPKKVALWNKRHFVEEKTESVQHVQNIQYVYLLNKYIKCNIWRLAVRYDIYIYIYVIRRIKVNLMSVAEISSSHSCAAKGEMVWDVTPCWMVNSNRHSNGTQCPQSCSQLEPKHRSVTPQKTWTFARNCFETQILISRRNSYYKKNLFIRRVWWICLADRPILQMHKKRFSCGFWLKKKIYIKVKVTGQMWPRGFQEV